MLKEATIVTGLFWEDSRLNDDDRISTMLHWLSRWSGVLNNLDNPIILFMEKEDKAFEKIILGERKNIQIIYLDIFREYKTMYDTIKNVYDNLDNRIKEYKKRRIHYRTIFIYWLKTFLVMRAYDLLINENPNNKDIPIMWVDFGIEGYIDTKCVMYDNDIDTVLACTCSENALMSLNYISFEEVIERFYKCSLGICIMGGCFITNYKGWKFFNGEIAKIQNKLIETGNLVDDDTLYDMVYQKYPDKFKVLTLEYPYTGFQMIMKYIEKLDIK